MAVNDKLYRKIQAIARAANDLLTELDKELEEKANQDRIRSEYNRLGEQLGASATPTPVSTPITGTDAEVKNPVVTQKGRLVSNE